MYCEAKCIVKSNCSEAHYFDLTKNVEIFGGNSLISNFRLSRVGVNELMAKTISVAPIRTPMRLCSECCCL